MARRGYRCISTHALTWSATSPTAAAETPTADFNSRAHVERDAQREAIRSEVTAISTHALTWSATRPKSRNLKRNLFQLTRSRGARPELDEPGTPADRISTHALTWSATGPRNYIILNLEISTHALTWSATWYNKLGYNIIDYNFNSRAHVERDEAPGTL